jgi:hypothetical protein
LAHQSPPSAKRKDPGWTALLFMVSVEQKNSKKGTGRMLFIFFVEFAGAEAVSAGAGF